MKLFGIRIIWIIILFMSTTVFPWYVVFGGAFILGLFFDYFVEMMVIGIFYDIMFHIPNTPWYQSFFHTLIMVGLFGIVFFITKITQKPKIFLA